MPTSVLYLNGAEPDGVPFESLDDALHSLLVPLLVKEYGADWCTELALEIRNAAGHYRGHPKSPIGKLVADQLVALLGPGHVVHGHVSVQA